MTFKDDIIERINSDFGENASKATTMLLDAINKVDYLKTDRIIRCIIYLAKGNLTELDKYIETATFDTRDVMLWAEYEGLKENENPKRVRDFNKTFTESSKDVNE
jgi:galactose-1-phosphate uridylyltransferase